MIQRFGKAFYKSFGRKIDCLQRAGHEASAGTHIENAALRTFGHLAPEVVAQRDQCFDVEVDHFQLVFEFAVDVPPLPAKTCIVDQNINLQTRLGHLADQLGWSVSGSKVSGKHMRFDAMCGLDLGGERLELAFRAGGQHDIPALLCVIAGESAPIPEDAPVIRAILDMIPPSNKLRLVYQIKTSSQLISSHGILMT